MKGLLAALMMLAAPSFAAPLSRYAGKLDLSGDPEAIAFRELNDGMWLVGAQKGIWKLVNLDNGSEVVHLAAFYATRLEGQSPAYGPAIGLNFGEAVKAAISKVEILAPLVPTNLPPWVGKLGDWTSLDAYGGYRPSVAADQHHIIYGFGGKIRIPIGQAAAWASGSWSSNNAPANKGL